MSNYINLLDEHVMPLTDIIIGQLVVEKNRNGNYYYGHVVTGDIWHDAWGVNGHYRRWGIKVQLSEDNEHYSISQKTNLFIINIKEAIDAKQSLLDISHKLYSSFTDIQRRYDTHFAKSILALTNEISLLKSLETKKPQP